MLKTFLSHASVSLLNRTFSFPQETYPVGKIFRIHFISILFSYCFMFIAQTLNTIFSFLFLTQELSHTGFRIGFIFGLENKIFFLALSNKEKFSFRLMFLLFFIFIILNILFMDFVGNNESSGLMIHALKRRRKRVKLK